MGDPLSWVSLLRRVVLLEQMSGDVRPEFDKFRADHAFCGDGDCPVERLLNSPIRSRVISIGNTARDEVAQHIRVVWAPAAIVALTPNSRRGGVQKPRSEATSALTKIARVLLQDDRKDSIAP